MTNDEFCKLTLKDCESIMDCINLANDAVYLAEVHGMNPFQGIEAERYNDQKIAFDKIEKFIELKKLDNNSNEV
jgi:hypothetical protein